MRLQKGFAHALQSEVDVKSQNYLAHTKFCIFLSFGVLVLEVLVSCESLNDQGNFFFIYYPVFEVPFGKDVG